MVEGSRRCRFSANLGLRRKLSADCVILFAGFLSVHGEAGVLLIEMSLEALLGIFRQTAEFDSHPDSRIPGPDSSSSGDTLLLNPKLHSQYCGNWQWHDCLNITTIAADVSSVHPHGSIHAFIAE